MWWHIMPWRLPSSKTDARLHWLQMRNSWPVWSTPLFSHLGTDLTPSHLTISEASDPLAPPWTPWLPRSWPYWGHSYRFPNPLPSSQVVTQDVRQPPTPPPRSSPQGRRYKKTASRPEPVCTQCSSPSVAHCNFPSFVQFVHFNLCFIPQSTSLYWSKNKVR